jgi:hypothetical protein
MPGTSPTLKNGRILKSETGVFFMNISAEMKKVRFERARIISAL